VERGNRECRQVDSLVQTIDQTGVGHLRWGLYVIIAIMGMVGTFLGALVGVWRFMRGMDTDRDARTRAIIRTETVSEERVRELIKRDAPELIALALQTARTGTRLDMRELLQEHESREDDRLARALQRVEADAKAGLDSLHGDARTVLEQLARQGSKVEALRTGLAVAQRDIAILMERAHLPAAATKEPATPSKP
jgi:hypothetical protein